MRRSMSPPDENRRPTEEPAEMHEAQLHDGVSSEGAREARLDQALEQVRHVLDGLRYGVVSIVVQDGVVVQIERTEKHRLRR